MKWISVDDELPAPSDPVLVCFDTTCSENQVDVCWLRAGLWWTDPRHALDRLYEIVHHWMPLSELRLPSNKRIQPTVSAGLKSKRTSKPKGSSKRRGG